MLDCLSDNNLQHIKDAAARKAYSRAFLFEYAHLIPAFVEFIARADPDLRQITCFTERKPDFTTIDGFLTLSTEEKPLSIEDYRKFLTAPPRIRALEEIPLHGNDRLKLGDIRRHFAMGRLRGVARRAYAATNNQLIRALADAGCCVAGMVLQALVPGLRRTKGAVKGQYRGIVIEVIFDGGPEKDHYGESPFIDTRLEALESHVKKSEGPAVFFIATGPRHEFASRILDMQDAGALKDFTIFAGSMYRPLSLRVTHRRPEGRFIEGTNKSHKGSPVYSDHCLSVGAGKHELWLYSAP